MLYSDVTIMDRTMGSDMDRTSGKTGRVFINDCCMGSPLLIKKKILRVKKAISPLV